MPPPRDPDGAVGERPRHPRPRRVIFVAAVHVPKGTSRTTILMPTTSAGFARHPAPSRAQPG